MEIVGLHRGNNLVWKRKKDNSQSPQKEAFILEDVINIFKGFPVITRVVSDLRTIFAKKINSLT